ncbi:MAG: mechanosensitive ion channel [Dysgonamonadaceae bacterium]|jgi:small conductance mechanosensitive channel|nr:mechanosensitive ion channel [Dysgonamonadaceae bacterium]
MPTLLNIHPTDSLEIRQIINSDSPLAEMIIQGRYEDIINKVLTWLISFGGKLLIAIAIFLIGRWIIKRVVKLENKIFRKVSWEPALKGFLMNLTKIALYVTLFMLIINFVGTKTISLAALIASAGLAIGLAVKDNLANFAGGVMLLFNKPFKSGDYIQAQGLEGIVKTVAILYTILNTPDNKVIYIPNGPLSTGNIVNFTTQEMRRLDAVARVEFGTPVSLVKETLMGLIKNHDKILLDPAPVVRMTGISDTSVDFQLRVWTKVENFWEVNFWLNEAIYTEFNNKGIGMPHTRMVINTPNNV